MKQYEFEVENMRHPVRGKIVKHVSNDGSESFTWSISHHYLPSVGAGVYFPSNLTTDNLEETEALFQMYAINFTAAHQVEKNEDF